MTNRFKNRHQNTIPKKILPPGAVRITKEDKSRVWLIGGREFDSKADYFQYLVDKALMDKAEAKSEGAGGADGTTIPQAIEAKPTTGD